MELSKWGVAPVRQTPSCLSAFVSQKKSGPKLNPGYTTAITHMKQLFMAEIMHLKHLVLIS